jgi:hypothetical protein
LAEVKSAVAAASPATATAAAAAAAVTNVRCLATQRLARAKSGSDQADTGSSTSHLCTSSASTEALP